MTLAEDVPTIGSRQILIALASNQASISRPNICDRSQRDRQLRVRRLDDRVVHTMARAWSLAMPEIGLLRHPLVRLAAEIDWGFLGGRVRVGGRAGAWQGAFPTRRGAVA